MCSLLFFPRNFKRGGKNNPFGRIQNIYPNPQDEKHCCKAFDSKFTTKVLYKYIHDHYNVIKMVKCVFYSVVGNLKGSELRKHSIPICPPQRSWLVVYKTTDFCSFVQFIHVILFDHASVLITPGSWYNPWVVQCMG